MTVQLDHAAAFYQPKEPLLVDAGKRPFPVAAEQVKRSPAKFCRACGPSAIEEVAAVVNEAQPTR
jgi:hypothetical protein